MMKAFSVVPMIAAFLLSTAIAIQAQNKPTLESAINSKVDVKHVQGTTMHLMGHAFDENNGFKVNQKPDGNDNKGIPSNFKTETS